MRIATSIAGLVALTAVIAAPLAPASAEPESGAPIPHTITGTGNYTGVLLNGLTVAFECSIVAPGASATSVDRCYLTTGASATPIALPGSAATTAAVATVPLVQFRLCWTGHAIYPDAYSKATSGCTNTPSVSGLPSLVGSGISD